MTPRTHPRAAVNGVFVVMAALSLCAAEPLGLKTNHQPGSTPRAKHSEQTLDFKKAGETMLSVDELRVVSEIARRIESTMSLAKGAETKVWPAGTRDPDGRLGIYLICSQPFLTPTNSPGMDDRKAWVVLAVFAAVKYTEDSEVTVDYIGLADPNGLTGDRWFYKLDMSTARHVQRELFSNEITLEQGYDRIVAAWHRVTPAS